MKCKHTEILYRWVDMNGRAINFSAGVGEVKKEYTCMQCGKTFLRKPRGVK